MVGCEDSRAKIPSSCGRRGVTGQRFAQLCICSQGINCRWQQQQLPNCRRRRWHGYIQLESIERFAIRDIVVQSILRYVQYTLARSWAMILFPGHRYTNLGRHQQNHFYLLSKLFDFLPSKSWNMAFKRWLILHLRIPTARGTATISQIWSSSSDVDDNCASRTIFLKSINQEQSHFNIILLPIKAVCGVIQLRET